MILKKLNRCVFKEKFSTNNCKWSDHNDECFVEMGSEFETVTTSTSTTTTSTKTPTTQSLEETEMTTQESEEDEQSNNNDTNVIVEVC